MTPEKFFGMEQYLPPPQDKRFHFEDAQVMEALGGTEYLRSVVANKLHSMTTGEKWSLYRAIAKLVGVE